MNSKNQLKKNDESKFEENDSSSFVIEIDKSVPKDPLKFPKNKIFEQVPIEESEEQYEVIESKSSCLCLNYLDNIDKKISKPLQAYPSNLVIEYIFFIFAKLFNTIGVVSYLSIILIYSLLKNHIFIFLIPLTHVIIGAIITLTLKKVFGRNRPKVLAKRYFNNVRNKETSKSMPSGDCLQSAIFATMVILYLDSNIKYLAIILVPGVMCARIYFNCHYWFDCIFGVLIGIFASISSYMIINKIQLHFFKFNVKI